MKNNNVENHGSDFWYRLDNVGKIYPSIISPELTTVYRFSSELKYPVKIANLQSALHNIISRFPYFRVYLRRGFFWYYLEHTKELPEVMPDTMYPCEKIHLTRKGSFLFRVKAYKNTIAVEFTHILTDGTGALNFLKALAGEYIRLSYGPPEDWGNIFRAGQEPDSEESEDAFLKYYNNLAPPPQKLGEAFHLPYRNLPAGIYKVLTGIADYDKLSSLARSKDVTVNDLLTALLIDSFQDLCLELNGNDINNIKTPIRIVVPINLRKFFPSKTMRNFFLYTSPEIDIRLGRYSFDEILKKVHYFILSENNAKSIQPVMARNVRGEKYLVTRIAPRRIKDIYLNFIFNSLGEKPSSSSISNLGIVDMPDKFTNYIEGFDFIPIPSSKTKCNCGVITYNNRTSISFGRTISETGIERLFFNKLIKMGIKIKILTN